MRLNRRTFLKLTALIASQAALSACSPVYRYLTPTPAPLSSWPTADHGLYLALSRCTFGPRAEERATAAEMGLGAWLEEQLAPEQIDDPDMSAHLRRFSTLEMTANDLYDWSDQLFDGQNRTTVPNELRQATLLRQLYSRRQLVEVMVEFWSDHFNISVDKGDCFYLKTVDDRTVIRAHALGNFGDLLQASAHSPAMLVYLDNQANEQSHPNENYARELLELHTLGVDGGYTQADVMELARCLTGWTVKEHWWRGEFIFDADRHDHGAKHVLGQPIDAAGPQDAEAVIDRLAHHPRTAAFLAQKLAIRLLGPNPAQALVRRAAQAFEMSGGDIRALLRVLLLDGLAQGIASPKFKRPVHFVTSALRQLNAATDGGLLLHDLLARMGQPLFGWPTPDGYPDHTEAWRGNLLPRWQFALALAQDELAGTTVDLAGLLSAAGADNPASVVDSFGALLLGAPLPASARAAILSTLPAAAELDDVAQLVLVGLMAAPAFQWR